MPTRRIVSGLLGHVEEFIRSNNRSPAREFLEAIEEPMWRRFTGSFGAAVAMGIRYHIRERFEALVGKTGKPLWEFKEFDHRLYCFRDTTADLVRFILFNGWIKDKKGKSREEPRRVATAQNLLSEYLKERGR